MKAILLLGALCGAWAGPLAAQTRVGLDLGGAAFSGGSLDTSAAANPASLRPYHTTLVTLRVERMFGSRLGAAVCLSRGSPGVARETADRAIVGKDLLQFFEAAPELSVRLWRVGLGALWAHAGPLVDLWSPNGASDRLRIGAQAGVTLEWALGTRVSGSLRLSVARMETIFDAADLPAAFARRAMWRRAVAGGLSWRL